ncbi:MAG TPA: hypothetical protein VIG85_06310 [Comamonas sp.]|uniref:hypothetical protein n=1 Tax=Comamonas halotolerans TaxID=3041496 RepID=UPI0024E0A9FA|nr:hypothetical protein [Comamonas sp. NoAH]
MHRPALTPSEIKALQQYQRLSASRTHWLHRWVVELLPPLIFVGLWAWTERSVILLALIAVLVFFNLLRVVQQRRTVEQLAGMAQKIMDADNAVPAQEESTASGLTSH